MRRIAAILTMACFLAVSVPDSCFCALRMLISCPADDAAACEECPAPPCQSCCNSPTSCETTACAMPEKRWSSCPADACGYADEHASAVCLIFQGRDVALSSKTCCLINPPHLDSTLAERRSQETDDSNADTIRPTGRVIPKSGRMLSRQMRPPGIHPAVSTIVLRC